MSVKSFFNLKSTNKFYGFWQLFYQDKIALYSLYLFVSLIILMIFSHIITPYNNEEQFVNEVMLPPYWSDGGVLKHFLGTDALGRDILSRLLIGSIYTFGSALIVSVLVTIIGGAIGLLVGFSLQTHKPWQKLLENFSVLPTLFIAIIITSLTSPSLINVVFAVLIALLPGFIFEISNSLSNNLDRGDILLLRLDNANRWEILYACFMPDLGLKFLKEFNRIFIVAMIDISALNFLSLGVKIGTSEWGMMIKESLHLIFISPWNVVIPGLTLSFIIIVEYVLNNGICHAIEKLYE